LAGGGAAFIGDSQIRGLVKHLLDSVCAYAFQIRELVWTGVLSLQLMTFKFDT